MTLIEQTDRTLTMAVNQFAGHSIFLDKLMYYILDTALLNGGVFLAAYCWLWFETDENGVHSQRRNVVVGQMAILGVAGIVVLLKVFLPFRHNPLNSPDLGLRLAFGVDPASLATSNSFPSGHAALFFALSVPLWRRSRWLGAASAVWIFLSICLPLLFLGDHWPSDIVAGATIGIASMLLLCRLIGATRLPGRLLRFSKTHPSAFYAMAWMLALETALRFADAEKFASGAGRLAQALLYLPPLPR